MIDPLPPSAADSFDRLVLRSADRSGAAAIGRDGDAPRAESGADAMALLWAALPQAAALLDAQGRIVLATPALGRLRGLPMAELSGQDIADWLEPDGRQAWVSALADAAAGVPAGCAVALQRPSPEGGPVAAAPQPVQHPRFGDAAPALAGTDDGLPALSLSLQPARPGRADALVLLVHEPLRLQRAGARPAGVQGLPAAPNEGSAEADSDSRMLQWIARATAPHTGQDFFRILMRNLAEAFGLRRAFIAECINRPTTRVRTLAFWSDAQFRDDFEFDLAGTPCEMTLRDGRVYCVDQDLQQRYAWARRQSLDSYLGAPIFDGSGQQLIGHVAFETSGRIDPGILQNPLFQIFVSRAAAELRRKRAEDVLRASEENYRLLVAHQTDVIVKLDSAQRVLFASPSFCRLFGVDEASLPGQPCRPPVAAEDAGRFDRAWAALGQPPHESQFEERVVTTQGWRCIAWSQKAMLAPDGSLQAVVAVGRDVTERLRAEEQGRQHLQQLAHVGRLSAMGEMASAIAHEINQPLTAMRTYAQASQRLLAAGAAPGELSDTLGRIATQAERASEIIRRLRGFLARDEVRTLPVEPNYIVSEVIGLARADALQCGVQLLTELAGDLPRVDVDCIQIEQVLLNLVRNGIEAIQQAGSAERRLCIRTVGAGGEVRLSVHDSGPGVPAASAEKIFEAFVSGKPGGMGIGLAISRSIAEAHRGRLWLDEAPAGGGALFHLALPALPD